MLPSAVPAIARRARERDGVLAAPLFAGSYLVAWTAAGLATYALYRSPATGVAVALVAAAVLYELTPLKRACADAAARSGAPACGSAAGASARASG